MLFSFVSGEKKKDELHVQLPSLRCVSLELHSEVELVPLFSFIIVF